MWSSPSEVILELYFFYALYSVKPTNAVYVLLSPLLRQYMLKYLIDGDWSVNAGNWMWVSSSAFEKQLDCSECICPVKYGKRVEPSGDFIR